MVVRGSHQEILDPGFVLCGHYVLRFRWWLEVVNRKQGFLLTTSNHHLKHRKYIRFV
ncbi:unnamed protein product [Schistosoma margrebowiei]|uniref:Uncharacterized protein n=1 Tax=Schistosoma margrebowiei TaxID=48269 RepID=A0A183LZM8_9TREM|nr:unnamed protein product [Schistosoma margrebowiei]